jgi:hypothetical protein
VPSLRSAVFILSVAVCVRLGAQNELRQYKETHGSRVSLVEYAVSRTETEISVRSSGNGATDEMQWVPGNGTVSWREKDTVLDNDMLAERTGDIIRIKGRVRGQESDREVHIDGAPWYQIFGPIVYDLLPPGMAEREFWVIDSTDFTAHKMLVRRAGAEILSLRGSRIETEKIHFSPAGALAPFWGADFWYRQRDAAWLYSRLPENGGVTVDELEEPGAEG